MIFLRNITLVFLLFLTSMELKAVEASVYESAPEGMEEGIYELYYSNMVKTCVSVFVSRNAVYIPLLEVFDRLKIYYDFDKENNIITGFFIHRDSTFTIDLNKQEIKFTNRIYSLRDDRVYQTTFDVFVNSSLPERVFGMKMKIKRHKLKINIDRSVEYPVMTNYKRQKSYKKLQEYQSGISYAPLQFSRERSILNGGIINYDLMARNFRNNNYYNYNLQFGMEALGGDLQLRDFGSYSDLTGEFNDRPEFTWRYHISDNQYLSSISAGEINNINYRAPGAPNYIMRGFLITNEPVQAPIVFNEYSIENKSEPGWQVELYNNGSLAAHTIADDYGDYRFDFPLLYGSSELEIRQYGPRGEYKTDNEMIHVGYEFLKPMDLRYFIKGGKRIMDGIYSGEAGLSFGITDWLTNTSIVGKNEAGGELGVYNSLRGRLFNGSLEGAFDYAHNKLSSFNLRSYSSFWGSPDVTYTKFYGLSDLNRMGMKDYLRLSYFSPNLFSKPVYFQLRANLRNYENSRIVDYQAGLNFRIADLYFRNRFVSVNTISDINDNYSSARIDQECSYYIRHRYKAPFYLNRTVIKLRNIYDLNYGGISNSGISIEQVIARNARFVVNFSRDFMNDYNRVSASLSIDFNALRTQSQAEFANDDNAVYTQRIIGQVGFDVERMDVIASNSRWNSNVATSSASIRLFLDENANDIYDEGEIIIPDVDIDMSDSRARYDRTSNARIANNLNPYWQYNVLIDKTSIKNPLWIPKFTEFSIIADPSSFKAIDVPCYSAGIIEGAIQDEQQRPVSRIKIHIESPDNDYHQELRVYSDGSFYFMGLPPGRYRAYPDSVQMALLNYEPYPQFREFEIKKTKDGDFVDGLNFNLELLRNEMLANRHKTSKKIINFSIPSANSGETEVSKHDSKGAPSIESTDRLREDIVDISETFYFRGGKDYMPTREMARFIKMLSKMYHDETEFMITIIVATASQNDDNSIFEKRLKVLSNFFLSKGIPNEVIIRKLNDNPTQGELNSVIIKAND